VFEYSIQKAWEEYHKDMGLGRIAILVGSFNLLFFVIGIFIGVVRPLALAPVVLALVYILMRAKFLKLPVLLQFILAMVPIILSIKLNYLLVGQYDQMAGGFTRLDPFFMKFDQWLFGEPVALVFRSFFEGYPTLTQWVYDFMMLSYFLYFILPIYGAILYYNVLPKKERYYLGRYFASVVIFFNMNFLFYLAIPVTGPQYFLEEKFTRELPFSAFGHALHSWVGNAQTAFIDCFPSGHTGMAVLVGIWLFRLNLVQRFIISPITLGIVFATLALRYHYVLDVVAAFPMALICYTLSFLLIPLRSHRWPWKRHYES
jgi:membrane-associated phospholipid phosphatase